MSEQTEIERLKDIAGSCDCLAKTPAVEHHDPLCKYRLLRERNEYRAASRAMERDMDALRQRCEEAEAKERDTASVANAALSADLATIHALEARCEEAEALQAGAERGVIAMGSMLDELRQRCERLERALRDIVEQRPFLVGGSFICDDTERIARAALEWISREANSEAVPLVVTTEPEPIKECRHDWRPGRSCEDRDGVTVTEYTCTRCGKKEVD